MVAAIPALIAAGGAVAGAISQGADRSAAQQAAMSAYDQLVRAGNPPDLSKQIVLEQFRSAGTLTPELEQFINAGPSQAAQVQTDSQTRNAQLAALAALQQRANTGLSAADVASMNQVQNQDLQSGQAKQNQIIQDLAQRGLESYGGTGAELAARLSGAQNTNNEQMQAGLNIAGQASNNALAALTQSGNLAGEINNQAFGQAMQKAQAADAFRNFDVMNQLGVQSQNINAKNAAQQYNLQNSQNILNANTQQDNAERYREAEAQRQYWQDLMAENQAKANALLGKAGVYNSSAAYTGNMVNSVAGGLASGVGAYNNYAQGQQYQNNMLDAYKARTAALAGQAGQPSSGGATASSNYPDYETIGNSSDNSSNSGLSTSYPDIFGSGNGNSYA